MIQAYYGNKLTNRSKVPLINHIDEGLIILDHIGASRFSKDAFCIHPLLQTDDDLVKNASHVCDNCSPQVVLLAMEYRSVANEFLLGKLRYSMRLNDIRMSPLQEVHDMLIADKVQNKKDFMRYHHGTHPRSDDLEMYFDMWLQRLGISQEKYKELCELIDSTTNL